MKPRYGDREHVERRFLLQFVAGHFEGDELRSLGWDGLGKSGTLLRSVRSYVEENGVGPPPPEWSSSAGNPGLDTDVLAKSDAIWKAHMQPSAELFNNVVLDTPAHIVQREVVAAGLMGRESARLLGMALVWCKRGVFKP
jgi:hypothetical protein